MINSERLKKFEEYFLKMMDNKKNKLHPLVWVHGDPVIGKNVYVGGFSEINANGARVVIEDNCDIASFVAINCQDTHKRCIGLKDTKEAKTIIIENNVFIGSHCVVKGGAHIGHHSVIAAGTIVEGIKIPPYSLAFGNPIKVRKTYYRNKLNRK